MDPLYAICPFCGEECELLEDVLEEMDIEEDDEDCYICWNCGQEFELDEE